MNEQHTQAAPQPKGRVQLLDQLRGFSVLSMILYHGTYDLVFLFGVNLPWFGSYSLPRYVWQQSICWVFILVSGASLHYGRHTARRGLVVLGCAALVTLSTVIAMPQQLIVFGVLHFLAAAMLISAAVKPLLQKIPPAAGLAGAAALFVLLRGVPQGFIGLLDFPLFQLPGWLYGTEFLFWLGFPSAGFFSTDYVALIPWLFLYWAGYFGWALLKDKLAPKPAGGGPLAFVGRHSLLIYVLHQPVLYGVLYAVFWLFVW